MTAKADRPLTRRQAIVLRALYDGRCSTPKELRVRSDVLWRLSERGLVGRTARDEYYIRPAGRAKLDAYTSQQATRQLGERRELARQLRKRLAVYLYWLEACGRDEAKAHRVLLAARAELGRLVGLDAAAAGIGGKDAAGYLETERLAGQLEEGTRLLGEAEARIGAGTRMLHVLAALTRSWEVQEPRPGETAAEVLRACAVQLREAVAGVHAPIRPAVLGSAREAAPGIRQELQHLRENPEVSGLDYETCHRVALARELTYAAGCPLRDRYGFAAAEQDVLFVVDAVFREPDDARARFLIGSANGDQIELAMPDGTITDEAYEMAIVRALRPLADQRRDAAAQSL